jgi:hypothetical protein
MRLGQSYSTQHFTNLQPHLVRSQIPQVLMYHVQSLQAPHALQVLQDKLWPQRLPIHDSLDTAILVMIRRETNFAEIFARPNGAIWPSVTLAKITQK